MRLTVTWAPYHLTTMTSQLYYKICHLSASYRLVTIYTSLFFLSKDTLLRLATQSHGSSFYRNFFIARQLLLLNAIATCQALLTTPTIFFLFFLLLPYWTSFLALSVCNTRPGNHMFRLHYFWITWSAFHGLTGRPISLLALRAKHPRPLF